MRKHYESLAPQAEPTLKAAIGKIDKNLYAPLTAADNTDGLSLSDIVRRLEKNSSHRGTFGPPGVLVCIDGSESARLARDIEGLIEERVQQATAQGWGTTGPSAGPSATG